MLSLFKKVFWFISYLLNNRNSTFDCDECKKPILLHSIRVVMFIVTKNLKQSKMNPIFINELSGSFHINVSQCLQEISEAGMNQPETHLWLAKCLPGRISHTCRRLSSLTTLWTFIPICTSIVKETINHWTIRRTEARSIQSER